MCDECEKLKYQLTIAISALESIRLNRKHPQDWEARVIDKTLKLIHKPEDFDWSHLKRVIERNRNG